MATNFLSSWLRQQGSAGCARDGSHRLPATLISFGARPLRFRVFSRAVALLILTAIALIIPACGPTEEQRLAAIYAAAATNPPGAQAEIVKQWKAGDIKFDTALTLGHERSEKNDPGAPAFSLALLGAISELQGPITQANVNEFFWIRTGTLAGSAAATAFKLGDLSGARALVLAGPNRWQTEAFWRMHPDHDALASWIMHKSGESGAAVARLRERAEPDQQVVDVMQRIQDEQRVIEAAKAKAAREKKK